MNTISYYVKKKKRERKEERKWISYGFLRDNRTFKGYSNLLGKSSSELDLTVKNDVFDFINKHKPDVIINAAAKVGGIVANSENKLSFMLDNISIQNNLLEAALDNNIPN